MTLGACAERRHWSGFTLVELLVAMTVLLLILVMTVQMVNGTSRLTQRARARTDAFQEGRAGFESVTRRISQAVLNTYWDYTPAPPQVPTGYVRQSELHFVSGQASRLLSAVNGTDGQPLRTNTHAIFFQALLGYSSNTTSTVKPANLLNACGYFVEFGGDKDNRPTFLQGMGGIPIRYRYRLSEMVQPTENLEVYQDVSAANASRLNNWFVVPLNSAPPPKRTLAENVLALIVLPQRSPNDPAPMGGAAELAPSYDYDSRLYQSQPGSALADLTRNQLPPLVQVTMVVLDEQSAIRLQQAQADKTQPPAFGLDDLFQTSARYAQDLKTLEGTLISQHLGYRVFAASVNIQQAKWSER